MKKNIPILIAVLIGAGCLGFLSWAANAQDETRTQSEIVPIDCEGAPITHINIVFGKGVIIVLPPRAETYEGYQLQFNVPANITETVYIGGKETAGVWLVGQSTTGANKFSVCVPEKIDMPDPDEGKVFGYFVNIPGVAYLDPEVIVRRGN